MLLERLELRDWRNHRATVLEPGPGATLLLGANAQGKTNLVEAVHYLAIGASHRVTSDAALIRRGAESAVLRSRGRGADGRVVTVDVELRAGGGGVRRRWQRNGAVERRAAEVVGRIPSVLFAPEDLALVRGDPGDRRRFLDDLLGLRRPAYTAARREYDGVLRQRNALLKQRRTPDPELLGAWTAALVRHGGTVLAARIAAVHALAAPLREAYADLVAGSAEADRARLPQLTYALSSGRQVAAAAAGVPDPAVLAAELEEALAARAAEEAERGITLAGPHRDDLLLHLGELPAKGYASHGEQWSLTLALRLASREVIAAAGEEPLVLLDDVFAELDEQRRARLAARCAAFPQVLVTAAVADDVPLAGPRLTVTAGTVTR